MGINTQNGARSSVLAVTTVPVFMGHQCLSSPLCLGLWGKDSDLHYCTPGLEPSVGYTTGANQGLLNQCTDYSHSIRITFCSSPCFTDRYNCRGWKRSFFRLPWLGGGPQI